MTNMTEYVSGKDWTSNGSLIHGKGEALGAFRGLQADLNAYARAASFEGVQVDGIIGPRTVEAVQKVVGAVLAKNALLVPAAFTYDKPEAIAQYASRIRDWLHTLAAQTLQVVPFRIYVKGTGKDWNIKGDIAYGAGAVHDEFVGLQRDLNKLADTVGFKKLEIDGFIGPRTAAATKATFEKLVAKNPLFGVTLFPPPDTKEETAEFAAFIRNWIETVATKQLLGQAGA
ncbi:MAG: peptidoglycan-binding domain-containing protein [Kofleriaceae bacterium]